MWLRKSIVVKSLTGLLLLLVIYSLIVSWIGYHGFTSVLMEQYQEGAFHTADSAAQMVNPDHFDRFVEKGGDLVEYRTSLYNLEKLTNSQGVMFIYVIRPDLTDYGHISFLYSTVQEGREFSPFPFLYLRETTNDEYKAKYRALYAGESEREVVIRDRGYIETHPHITAMIPLKDSGGKVQGILCVQRQMEDLARVRKEYLHRIVLVFFLVALFVTLGQALYLNRMLLAPLSRITEEAERFAATNERPAEKLTDAIKNVDEIGTLAGAIDQMEEQIGEYVENLTVMTREQERLNTELNVAWAIQSGVLPKTFPAFPDRKEFDIYALVDPAKQVGGDFYDFFMVDDDHLAFLVADVAGKGIPGALFMMISKILIKNRMRNGDQPGPALVNVNNQLMEGNEAEMFVTVWIAVLELSTGHGVVVNAGHEHPAFCPAGGRYGLVKYRHSIAVSVMENMPFREREFDLKPGDSLFIYSDGVPEATNAQNELFGTDRLIESLNRDPSASTKETLSHVLADIGAFVGGAEQFDDITMLCLKYYGSDGAAGQGEKREV